MSLKKLGYVLFGVVVGCGGGGSKTAPPTLAPGASPETAGGPSDWFLPQADLGGKLYAANCAKCHGDNGEGTPKGPDVAGKDSLPLNPPATEWGGKRGVTFKTAGDVYKFVKKAMPADDPAALKDDEYLAIVAWEMQHANLAGTPDKALDAAGLDAIVLHK